MSSPARTGAPWFALVGVTLLAAGVLSLVLISRMPGPQAPGALRQMLVLHSSMAEQLAPARTGLSGPTLHLESTLEGDSVSSWLYSLAGQAATAHRFGSPPPMPRNAQSLPAPGGPVSAADFDELCALCWTNTAGSWCVVGPQPVAQLKELVSRVRSQGPGAPEADQSSPEGVRR